MEKLQPKLRFPEFKENWEEKKIDDICHMQAGKFIQASKISENLESNFFPCYGGNGLRGYTNTFNYEGKYSLIGRQGALCGNVNLVNNKFYATEHAIVVNLKPYFDTDYTYYLLGLLNLNQYATGQAQPGLSVQNLKEIKAIVSNSLPEQQKIATFLTTVDDKINVLKQKVSLLEKYKKGVMQQIFSQQIRFKHVNGNYYPEWEEKCLGEVCDVKKGEQFNKEDLNESDLFPCINGGVEPSGYTHLYNRNQNTITISEGGNSCGFINFIKTKFWCGGHCYTIELKKSDFNINYLYQLLKSYQNEIMKLRVGSGLPNIQKKDLLSFNLVQSANFEEQTKIAEFLSGIDEKIETTKLQLSKMEVWKKGLLQGMFC